VTVSAQTSFNSSTGNGVTTVFPYTFKIIAAGDIDVSVDGVAQTLTTHYTLSGVGDNAGGNVTFLSAPANGTLVVRRRDMALTRATDYQYQGNLPAAVLNPDLDAPVLMAQQLQEQISRSARGPAGETWPELAAAADRLDLFPVFDAATGELELSSITQTQVASAVAAAYSAGQSTADAITFIQAGTGAVSRTVQAKERDHFSVKDFGAVGNGSADDTDAVQKCVTAAVAAFKAVYFPSGTYLITTTITATGWWCYYGDGNTSIVKTADDIALFTFNINTTAVYAWEIRDLRLEGPFNSSNVASCAIRFIGDATAYIAYGYCNVSCVNFNAFVKDEKLPRTTGFGLEAMVNWNRWDVTLQNQTTYGFWLTQGSGTGSVYSVIAVLLSAGSAAFFFDGSGCVVGDVIIDGQFGCQAAGGIGIKIGASTVYRAQWDISGCQFDANCNIPISMSATGAITYDNWHFGPNNMGGNTTLGLYLQPMSNSIIIDRDTDERRAGKTVTTNTIGALSTAVFKLTFAQFGSCNVRVYCNGTLGGVGAGAAYGEWSIVAGTTTLTEASITNRVSQFTVAFSKSGLEATITITGTSSATGTGYNATLIANGNLFKVERL
jgi:hypothetical protein